MSSISFSGEATFRPTAFSQRDTKTVGDRSEAVVLATLVRRGFRCALPFGENRRYDILADDGTAIHRIQVKTGRLRGGSVQFACSSSHGHRRSGHDRSRPYFGQIDYLAVYCPQNEKVYLLPESEIVATKAHLRIDPTANRQAKGIRWGAQFELV